jgi:aerobic-type carbon monoxide dehydrogenase small subunit (CoxS/CutS family)
MKTQRISMTVNGGAVGPYEIPDGLSMNDFLREYLNLTGTKFGCGVGACSACVVILDHPDGTSSTEHTCITDAEFFDGKSLRTIEGIAQDGKLTAVQAAFLDHFAFQCGYCTPGFVNQGHGRGARARADSEDGGGGLHPEGDGWPHLPLHGLCPVLRGIARGDPC